MSLIFGGTTVNNVIFNGTTVDRIVFNGVEVYTSKPAKFIYWNGEYGLFTSSSGDSAPWKIITSRTEEYAAKSARIAYFNSDGIYFQDNPNPSGQSNRLDLRVGFPYPYGVNNVSIYMKDVYLAIDNFVGNPISIWFQADTTSNHAYNIFTDVSSNTVLHVNITRKEKFKSIIFADRSGDTFGISYVIRRIWYDTY